MVCCGRYKEGRYPENMESLTISNTSMMEAEVTFFFHKDCSGNVYLLDPPTMKLESGHSKVHNSIHSLAYQDYVVVSVCPQY